MLGCVARWPRARGLLWLTLASTASRVLCECDHPSRVCTCRNRNLECLWEVNVTASAPFLFCVDGGAPSPLRLLDAVAIRARFAESRFELHGVSEDTYLTDLVRASAPHDRARVALNAKSVFFLAAAAVSYTHLTLPTILLV